MRILHVITSLNTGGAEHLMVDLLPRLRDRGNDVELCLFNGSQTSFYKRLEEEGIKIHSFNESLRYYNPLHIWRLRKLMKGFDVVHTHNTAPQLFAAIGRRKNIRMVTTEHSTSTRRRNYRLLKCLDRWMYGRYDKIICISQPSEDSLKSYLDGQTPSSDRYPIVTIQNGVDVSRFLHASPIELGLGNCKVITMVAGFRYEKDHPTLIRSLLYLPEDYHVVLVGYGVKQSEMEQLAKENGLTQRVHFLGVRSDVPSVLKSSDVIVMSSHREGLSLSNVEGMCSGHPFVASDVEGLREVTQGAGILFPHGDSEALASIIQQLCTDTDYAQEIAKKCQERAKQYDIEKMVDGYNEVYNSLMRGETK